MPETATIFMASYTTRWDTIGAALASKAQAMLVADMSQPSGIRSDQWRSCPRLDAPLAMRWWPVLPGLEPALCYPHQPAQMVAYQGAAIIRNLLKPHGF